MRTRNRAGFTIVELLIVAVLATVVIGAVYSVLISSQRTFTMERAKVRGTETMRAGMDLLFNELREISPGQGDLISMADDSLAIRAGREFGLVCAVGSPVPPYRVTVLKVGDGFTAGDSVFIFADNDTKLIGDDIWVGGTISSVSEGGNCNGMAAQGLNITASPLFAVDSVRVGAPVRSFTRYSYSSAEYYYGDTYLVRWDPENASRQAVVGPLADDGLSFRYFDANGLVTLNPFAVRQIEVTLRTDSPARNLAGDRMADSVSTIVYTRN